ncbi:AprI/Inh family metalloprotease inhibitor [Pseudomonas sp. Ant30-3]|uniref:AprI/Inh family metalloprotease inhibitor n=1 Tax=Pseudomonas sp. Ant30-3 TaxID=1488328 RepID=UPI000490C549|nr:AprI/Inh family metalloprotease inhibitor [Pseudomonas sp. Ant30-3]
MIQPVFTHRNTAWLLATFIMFYGDITMATSLKLADPSELAGLWQATLTGDNESAESQAQQDKPSNACTLKLLAEKTLGEGAECLSAWAGEKVVGWFPEPDGIAITRAEGSKVLFLSRQRDGHYQTRLRSGLVVIIKREVQ